MYCACVFTQAAPSLRTPNHAVVVVLTKDTDYLLKTTPAMVDSWLFSFLKWKSSTL